VQHVQALTLDAAVSLLRENVPANIFPLDDSIVSRFVEQQLACQPASIVLCRRLLLSPPRAGYQLADLQADMQQVAGFGSMTSDPRNVKTMHALVSLALQRLEHDDSEASSAARTSSRH
jgi:hypothetical protein